MGYIDKVEVKRRIGYLRNVLANIENNMLKEHSKRMDIKQRLHHLEFLQR